MISQLSTLNVLASSQQPKASRQNNNIALTNELTTNYYEVEVKVTQIVMVRIESLMNHHLGSQGTISLLATWPSNIST